MKQSELYLIRQDYLSKYIPYQFVHHSEFKYETYLLGDLFKTPYVKARIVDKTIPDKLFLIWGALLFEKILLSSIAIGIGC